MSTSEIFFRKKSNRSMSSCLFLFLLFLTSNVKADNDIERLIKAKVTDFAKSVGGDVTRIEIPPFTLPSLCSKPIDIKYSKPQWLIGRLSITLTCNNPNFWKKRINVFSEIKISVVVAKSALLKGQVIKKTDLTVRKESLEKIGRDYFSIKDDVIGNVMKRNIRAGTLLTHRKVEPPLKVKRGAIVSIKYSFRNLLATMKGEALQSGRKGEQIKIKNLSSQKVILTTVTGENEVYVAR
ncbi:flagellar basal body P-ring formation protein FlgA [Vibrio harveyi]|nr:flagellar basal body P-ring formation protein FlgA [Vibrio harveyi]